MKLFVLIITFLLGNSIANSQDGTFNRLKQKLATSTTDSIKSSTLDSLSMYSLFFSDQPDSTYRYVNDFVNYAFTLEKKKYLILAYARMGFYYINTSQFKAALDISLKGIVLSEEYNIPDYLSALYYNMAWVYYNLNDNNEAMLNANKGIAFLKDSKDKFYDQALHINGIIGNILLDSNKTDSAFILFKRVDSIASASSEKAAKDIANWYWGMYYLKIKNYKVADSVLAEGIASCRENGNFLLSFFLLYSAQSNIGQGKIQNAIDDARSAFKLSKSLNNPGGALFSASLLTYSFEQSGNRDSAYQYLKIKDSLRAVISENGNTSEIQQIRFDQQLRQKEKETTGKLEEQKSRNKITIYVFITALIFFLVLAGIQWRNSRHRKKANALLSQQKEKVESTLSELKSTQSQLIQSEKMASLGELTAGIAHEIQNPLNFVNNFSEVSNELMDEMKVELSKGNYTEVNAIADDIKQNLEKINHHGNRAGDIVKGMLQHSRSSSSVKEPTDINKLADEYLRLAYHGLRAKEKSFNATMKSDFDNSIGKVNIIPQDIGRVILNLLTNAFYIVDEKRKNGIEGYEPTVSINTKKINSRIEIKVSDNGNGIPKKVLDKIFQPFFTTKPTGKGTGLGLSLSYDIITKGHGGELSVETVENEGSTFTISLPM